MAKIDSTPYTRVMSIRLRYETYQYLCHIAEQLNTTPGEYVKNIIEQNLKHLREESKNG